MSAPVSIQYITQAGDRWDLLAWQYYGDPTQYSPIIMANPTVPIEPVFEQGRTIQIPILQSTPVNQNNLPPWQTL